MFPVVTANDDNWAQDLSQINSARIRSVLSKVLRDVPMTTLYRRGKSAASRPVYRSPCRHELDEHVQLSRRDGFDDVVSR
jgi:hypothetical protein